MRINTTFKDYYDPIAFQQYDSADNSYVWNRGQEVTFAYPRLKQNFWRRIDGVMCIIGFCGRFHLCWNPQTSNNPNTTMVYNIDTIKGDLLAKMHPLSHGFIDKWFNEIRQPDIALFVQHKTPTLIINPATGIGETDPVLRKFEFYRHIDPFTAWMEIQNFYHTHLITANDSAAMGRISDKDMAAAKGFGSKYDFRRLPNKSKNNERQNS